MSYGRKSSAGVCIVDASCIKVTILPRGLIEVIEIFIAGGSAGKTVPRRERYFGCFSVAVVCIEVWDLSRASKIMALILRDSVEAIGGGNASIILAINGSG